MSDPFDIVWGGVGWQIHKDGPFYNFWDGWDGRCIKVTHLIFVGWDCSLASKSLFLLHEVVFFFIFF